jgi:hypothetical protein
MGTILTYITLAVVLIVVVALVYYLVSITIALRNAGRNLYQLADGLNTVVTHTAPLETQLGTINGALGQLLSGLVSVNGHLAAVARVLGRSDTPDSRL